MFEKRSTQHELMDDMVLADDALHQNLVELEVYNNWLGAKQTLKNALNRIYQKHKTLLSKKEILIADMGCGGGDLLMAINHWAHKNQLKVKLLGIDVNPFMLDYAKKRVGQQPAYEFQLLDATQALSIQPDIICLNSVCHHFADDALVKLLKNLSQQTSLAVIINDLQRHWFSYYLFKWLTRLFNFSYLAQNDGPLSVLRAFHKDELISLLELAGIKNYEIRKKWLLRWQVIIWTHASSRD